ncbi:excisionase family DNA-binding protein [Luteococcus sanguinis]|uniref:Excisionase family DNA-binding protein n=1 Tax=Luteococcus sanguinis TaxID=174038 RepID=A0ABW1X0P1_9ACTN
MEHAESGIEYGRPGALLSLHEAALALGVSVATVRRYIADGRLVANRVGPRLIRVRAGDLAAVHRSLRPGSSADRRLVAVHLLAIGLLRAVAQAAYLSAQGGESGRRGLFSPG